MDGILMNEEIIRDLSKKDRVPIGTVEKDYVLTNILHLISQLPEINKIVFKGGTSLKKVHFSDFRYSEDIDFTCIEDISEELYALLEDRKDDFDFTITKIIKEDTVARGKRFTIKYIGCNKHPNNIRIDLSMRGRPQKESIILKATHDYDHIPTFNMPSMHIEEIMAEKVSAVSHSGAPRHLHDLGYLFDKQIPLDPELVRIKYRYYNEDFDFEKFCNKAKLSKKEWINELRSFLSHEPPSFDKVYENVLKRISEIMK
jgi:predicted nucleotidyltransferase component of viral defense system